MDILDSNVLTLAEAAEYLKISEKTILRMIHKNEIPCAKIGNQWRFLRSMIDDWVMSKMNSVPQNDLSKLLESEHEFFSVSRLIREESFIPEIVPGSKESILNQLIHPLNKNGLVKKPDFLLKKLIERELLASTAIGHGVAIPHVREPEENPNGHPELVVGICREGTHFNAPDDSLIQLFFLIYTDSKTLHLRLMSKLISLLRKPELVVHLTEANNFNEVLKIILAEEQKIHFNLSNG